MKIFLSFIKNSLTKSSISFKSQQLAINRQIPVFIINDRKLCSSTKRNVVIYKKFDEFLTKEDDFQKLKVALEECDTNNEDWRFKLLEKMISVFLNLEYEFGNLSPDKIELITQDYEKMRTRKLLPPKRLEDKIIHDLMRIIDNEKSRLHLLSFQGIKQLRRFKNHCDKQINHTFKKDIINVVKSDEKCGFDSIYYKKRKDNYYQHMRMLDAIYEQRNLVLDFSFSNSCLNSEHNSIVSQTRRLIAHNLISNRPFNLWFTSLDSESLIQSKLNEFNIMKPTNFINRTEQHFTNLFPKDKLIYLSPDAEEEIDKFDHQAVYILGAIVDRYEDRPLSFESSKKHKIRSLKLPIEKYVITSGLSLDISFLNVFQMLEFMQYDHAKWDNAFKVYLREDRKINDLELIDKFNPSLKRFNEKEIEKYKTRTKYQTKNRIYSKMKN